jgi:hypothetical protein
MNILTRDQILAKQELAHEEKAVPEWGGSVLVWELSGAERDELEIESTITDDFGIEQQDRKNVRARLVAKAIKDESGKPYFTPDDIEALGKLSGSALDRIFWVARKLSKFSIRDIEDLEKNSRSVPQGS